jgi:hypothetical protein
MPQRHDWTAAIDALLIEATRVAPSRRAPQSGAGVRAPSGSHGAAAQGLCAHARASAQPGRPEPGRASHALPPVAGQKSLNNASKEAENLAHGRAILTLPPGRDPSRHFSGNVLYFQWVSEG